MKKFLKKAGIWTGILVLVLILVSFLIPSEIHVKQSIVVNAPMFRVFEQVSDLRNWEKWSPWKRLDPTMVMTFSNPPVGEKAFYKWESENKNFGNGTLTLDRVVNEEQIVTVIEFEDHGTSSATFDFSHKGDAIEVTWSMSNKVGVMPWSKYMGLMMKSSLKRQFNYGLKGLKFYAEKS